MINRLKTIISLKRLIILSVFFILFSAISLYYADKKIAEFSENKTFNIIDSIPHNRVGLMLGTSKTLKSGRINQYFAYRVKAATELFKAGKIDYIIISGDNGRKTYDEPTDMKQELINNGIDSTKIYLDYAGFRTFDSMIRVKEIFGQDKITVISQHFHNERAIYIASKLGIDAVGFDAQDVGNRYGKKTMFREKFARVKVFVDFIIGTEPKFLGDKIEIK
ncbi:MAG: vancomycin high temperature exclusion protein [Bacteroidia bacterium]